MNNPGLTRFVRQTLYALKRDYGDLVDVYQLGTTSVDFTDGTRSTPRTSFSVKKCIVLPARSTPKIDQSISYLSASKPYVVGGSYNSGARNFIFERLDVPVGYEFEMSDYIVYLEKKYEVREIEELEFNAGWLLVAERVEGVRPELHINVNVTSIFNASQDTEVE